MRWDIVNVCTYVHSSRKVTWNKRLGLETLFFAMHNYACRKISLSLIFIKIVNVLDLTFKVKDSNRVHWEVHTWISHKRNDKWNKRYYCQCRKLHVASRLAYLHVIMVHYGIFTCDHGSLWHIYMWSWPIMAYLHVIMAHYGIFTCDHGQLWYILKCKLKVMNISTLFLVSMLEHPHSRHNGNKWLRPHEEGGHPH